ncbi:MAG: DUF882 domain-containing protein [Pseudomonadota bacterium]
MALGAAASLILLVRPAGAHVIPARRLFLTNLHTGEKFNDVYWANGNYIPDAMSRLDDLLRDHRTGEVREIDRGLIDLLSRLRSRLAIGQPLQVISGFRSAQSNAAARKTSRGVARNSLHMHAKAADIRVPGFDLASLSRAAAAMKVGGVGFYPRGPHVHLDVGPVRIW